MTRSPRVKCWPAIVKITGESSNGDSGSGGAAGALLPASCPRASEAPVPLDAPLSAAVGGEDCRGHTRTAARPSTSERCTVATGAQAATPTAAAITHSAARTFRQPLIASNADCVAPAASNDTTGGTLPCAPRRGEIPYVKSQCHVPDRLTAASICSGMPRSGPTPRAAL